MKIFELRLRTNRAIRISLSKKRAFLNRMW
jgi:hypothetical protein